jgi:hypothetical protein
MMLLQQQAKGGALLLAQECSNAGDCTPEE